MSPPVFVMSGSTTMIAKVNMIRLIKIKRSFYKRLLFTFPTKKGELKLFIYLYITIVFVFLFLAQVDVFCLHFLPSRAVSSTCKLKILMTDYTF